MGSTLKGLTTRELKERNSGVTPPLDFTVCECLPDWQKSVLAIWPEMHLNHCPLVRAAGTYSPFLSSGMSFPVLTGSKIGLDAMEDFTLFIKKPTMEPTEPTTAAIAYETGVVPNVDPKCLACGLPANSPDHSAVDGSFPKCLLVY